MMLTSKSIGHKITAARKNVHLSQADLAQQVSISPQAVGKWERGESMPDITTLNRLAEILGVDLNYFSEDFNQIANGASETVLTNIETLTKETAESSNGTEKTRLNWDMSELNLVDSDFSGLTNLHEKFSSSNIQRCLFVGSDMAGLLLNSNNVDHCDFTDSDISNSKFQNSNIGNNKFKNCSLVGTAFLKCNINACDFAEADLTRATFKLCNFSKNTLPGATWISTSFVDMQIRDLVFEGTLDGCFFENCAFYGVTFQNATLLNTFFKNNKKFKRVKFIDCKADRITYAFLKTNQADLTGVTLIA